MLLASSLNPFLISAWEYSWGTSLNPASSLPSRLTFPSLEVSTIEMSLKARITELRFSLDL